MLASATTTVLLAVSAAQFALYSVLLRALRNLSKSLDVALVERDLIRKRLDQPPTDRIISRSAGGTVGHYEVTLVGEDGREYVALPVGTEPDLEALLRALKDGSVLIIVGASGAEHVRLPPGSVVYTAAQTVDMFSSTDVIHTPMPTGGPNPNHPPETRDATGTT